jgi:hypothetical protein
VDGAQGADGSADGGRGSGLWHAERPESAGVDPENPAD